MIVLLNESTTSHHFFALNSGLFCPVSRKSQVEVFRKGLDGYLKTQVNMVKDLHLLGNSIDCNLIYSF